MDVCQYVCPFAGWLFWCEMGVTVNKDGVQSVKGGFPIIENVDVVEWKELDVVVECCENAVVNGGDINTELFLDVDWCTLRPS